MRSTHRCGRCTTLIVIFELDSHLILPLREVLQGRSDNAYRGTLPSRAMADDDLEPERRLQFLREHFLPADVRASWIWIRRRMIAKAIRRRWKQEARERRVRRNRSWLQQLEEG